MSDETKKTDNQIFDARYWVNVPTEKNIHKELVSSLGGDFFAVVDAGFLVSLFSAWQNAEAKQVDFKRCAFLNAFDRALDRAIKRKQMAAQVKTKQVYSKQQRKFIDIPVD